MDLQYFGGNCVVLTEKGIRVVIDDTLAELGLNPIAKQGDVLLFTSAHTAPAVELRLFVEMPGEYEVSDLSIVGIAARGHMDEPNAVTATMYKII
ncbi:MAG: MBL fold metallo-hydrolase, partial [Candidatus Micrarchaeaceae archaeon]